MNHIIRVTFSIFFSILKNSTEIVQKRHDCLRICRVKEFRFLDRYLAAALFTSPRFLSARTCAKTTSGARSVRDRFESWLWAHHSTRTSLVVAGSTCFGIVLIAALGSSNPAKMESGSVVASLGTVAAILGGAFGALQAVAAFMAQLRSQGRLVPLAITPLVARRYHSSYILGGILGVVLADAIGAIVASTNVAHVPFAFRLLKLNLFAVPLAALASLWYLMKVLEESGKSGIRVVERVVRAALLVEIERESQRQRVLVQYDELMCKYGIKVSPYIAQHDGLDRVQRQIGFGGVVNDVDLVELSRLGAWIHSQGLSDRVVISLMPGVPQTSHVITVLNCENGQPAGFQLGVLAYLANRAFELDPMRNS